MSLPLQSMYALFATLFHAPVLSPCQPLLSSGLKSRGLSGYTAGAEKTYLAALCFILKDDSDENYARLAGRLSTRMRSYELQDLMVRNIFGMRQYMLGRRPRNHWHFLPKPLIRVAQVSVATLPSTDKSKRRFHSCCFSSFCCPPFTNLPLILRGLPFQSS